MTETNRTPLAVFERHESNVRSYCRDFPVVFERAVGHHLWDTSGRRYVDLLCGAGSLNYGHNPPAIVERVTAYLAAGGPVQSLDLHTTAKHASHGQEPCSRNPLEVRARTVGMPMARLSTQQHLIRGQYEESADTRRRSNHLAVGRRMSDTWRRGLGRHERFELQLG